MKRLFTLCLFFITLNLLHAQPNWVYSLDHAKALATNEKKLLLVDFTAEWCGPCKKMDMSSWPDPVVDSLSDKFVAVKIDIDQHRGIAQTFMVNSIPRVMIMDINEDKLEDRLGYMDDNGLAKMLSPYPANMKIINNALIPLLNDNKNFISQYQVAEAYSKYVPLLDNPAKDKFLYLSNDHYQLAKKYAKKSDNSDYEEKAIIGLAMNSANNSKHNDAVKTIEKYGIDNFQENNLTYAYYVLAYSADIAKNKDDYDKYLAKLQSLKGGNYLAKMLQSN